MGYTDLDQLAINTIRVLAVCGSLLLGGGVLAAQLDCYRSK